MEARRRSSTGRLAFLPETPSVPLSAVNLNPFLHFSPLSRPFCPCFTFIMHRRSPTASSRIPASLAAPIPSNVPDVPVIRVLLPARCHGLSIVPRWRALPSILRRQSRLFCLSSDAAAVSSAIDLSPRFRFLRVAIFPRNRDDRPRGFSLRRRDRLSPRRDIYRGDVARVTRGGRASRKVGRRGV